MEVPRALQNTNTLRIIFFGSPAFSVPTLKAIHSSAIHVVAVYSQPQKKSGRGLQTSMCPVHSYAASLNIPVFTPQTLRSEEAQAEFENLCTTHKIDCAVVVAYGHILPPRVLQAPRLGCINIHASLLPRWRGAAPIQRAIQANDQQTGISFMQMDNGLDTGHVLKMEPTLISPHDTTQTLQDRLAHIGAQGIEDVLTGLNLGHLHGQPQPSAGVTYAQKISKEDGQIDWTKSALEIDAHLRAFTPWPGAFTHIGPQNAPIRLRILELNPYVDQDHHAPPGTVLSHTPLIIACREGCVEIKTVQKPGKKAMDTASFLRGTQMEIKSLLF